MSRSLENSFMNDLEKGKLRFLLERIQRDSTLDLQFRGNYINIYYRGGVILELKTKGNNYKASINKKYFEKIQNLYAKYSEKIPFPLAIQYLISSNQSNIALQVFATKRNDYVNIIEKSTSTDFHKKNIIYINILKKSIENIKINEIELLTFFDNLLITSNSRLTDKCSKIIKIKNS